MSDQATREEVHPRAPAGRAVVAETLRGGPLAITIPLAGAALLIGFPVLSGDIYWMRQICLIAVLALAVSGLNLSLGHAGEFHFGQVFVFALGAYATMIAASRGFNDVVVLIALGALVGALGGAAIALLSTRLAGWQLALTSFFLVVAIPDLVAIFRGATGGLSGLVGTPTPRLFGRTLGTVGLYEVIVGTTVVWFVFYRNLVTSRYGIELRILRESSILANSLGYSSLRVKALADVVGAIPVGIAGALFGFISLVIAPTTFDFTLAVGIVAASILGGIESIYGAILGALILQLGPQRSLDFQQFAPIAYGLFLVVAAIVFRGGASESGRAVARRLASVLDGSPDADRDEQSSGNGCDGDHFGGLSGRPLAVTSVSKRFGDVEALNDVSMLARPGEITGLIGSNGSGKTTVLNVVCGYERPDTGTVLLGDTDLTRLPPHAIAGSGIARSFQSPRIPRGLTALDIVASGRFHTKGYGAAAAIFRLPSYRRQRAADASVALSMLDLVGLKHLATRQGTSLAHGERRLVDVARALNTRPSLLLLDEPAEGLSANETARLESVLRLAAGAGATVVVIEHDIEMVNRIADMTYVLHLGTVVAHGPSSTVGRDAAMIESYLDAASSPCVPRVGPGSSCVAWIRATAPLRSCVR